MSSESNRLEMIKTMLAENPTDPFLLYAAALEYKKREMTTEAGAIFEQIVRDHPDYLAVYYQYGKFMESIDPERSAELYKKGIELAKKEGEQKTRQELEEALFLLD